MISAFSLTALFLSAAPVALICYTLWGIRRIKTPTKGARISRAERPNTALMIIDMQTVFTRMTGEEAWEEAQLGAAFARIRALTDQARAEGRKVIVVRQVFQGWYTNLMVRLTAKGRGMAGSEELELDPALAITPDLDIEKPFGDSFSADGLEAFLERHGIGALELTGLDGNHCVRNTALGALGRGYQVVLQGEAILAQDQAAWMRNRAALVEAAAKMA